jgi:hypothetical protein
MEKIPLSEVKRFAEGVHRMRGCAVFAEVCCVGFEDACPVFHDFSK